MKRKKKVEENGGMSFLRKEFSDFVLLCFCRYLVSVLFYVQRCVDVPQSHGLDTQIETRKPTEATLFPSDLSQNDWLRDNFEIAFSPPPIPVVFPVAP